MTRFNAGSYLNIKQAKFLTAGLLNTIVGYSIYAIFIALSVPYLTALFLATIMGVFFNYFSFGRLVFKSKGSFIIFVKFVVTYGFVYFVNAIALNVLIMTFNVGAYVGQALCVPLIVFLSWVLMNYWVYKND